jgi:hypothetical protein
MKNLNKSNFFLFLIESKKRTSEKKIFKNNQKLWVQNVPSTEKVGRFVAHNPAVNFSLLLTYRRDKSLS